MHSAIAFDFDAEHPVQLAKVGDSDMLVYDSLVNSTLLKAKGDEDAG